MELLTFSVGPLATNCYLVWDPSTRKACLIDPGDDGDFLSEQIHLRHLVLADILLTHGHFDHVLGLLPLHLNFPRAKIYLNPLDRFLYSQAGKSAQHWVPGYTPDPLPEGLSATPPDLVKTIETPGHTPGSVCYYLKENNWLFTGDTIFKGSLGSTNHRYSSPLKLSLSLQKLAQLPGETTLYPGHGEITTLHAELLEAQTGIEPVQ